MPGLESTSPADPHLLGQPQLPAEPSWWHSTLTGQCPRRAGELPPGLTPRALREQLIKGQGTPRGFTARVQLVSVTVRNTLHLCWQNKPHDSSHTTSTEKALVTNVGMQLFYVCMGILGHRLKKKDKSYHCVTSFVPLEQVQIYLSSTIITSF